MAADMEINVQWSKLYVRESMAGRFPVSLVDYWYATLSMHLCMVGQLLANAEVSLARIGLSAVSWLTKENLPSHVHTMKCF